MWRARHRLHAAVEFGNGDAHRRSLARRLNSDPHEHRVVVVPPQAERGDAVQELIKPGLFWVVRLGLLLSVVAWIVGQGWQGVGVAFRACGVIDQTGLVVQCHKSLGEGWGGHEEPNLTVTQNFLAPHKVPPDAPSLGLSVLAIHLEDSGAAFGIRHWFLVTIFVLFCAVLKWVYRKRRTEATSLSSSHSDEPTNEAHET